MHGCVKVIVAKIFVCKSTISNIFIANFLIYTCVLRRERFSTRQLLSEERPTFYAISRSLTHLRPNHDR